MGNVKIHFDGLDKSCSTVRCDCGHKFEFGKMPTGYCPGCGGYISKYLVDNIPFDEVPKGYVAVILKEYDRYHDEYYYNEDNWHELTPYLFYKYNGRPCDSIGKTFQGYCIAHDLEFVYANDELGFYGYLTKKSKKVKNVTLDEFKEIMQKEYEAIKEQG